MIKKLLSISEISIPRDYKKSIPNPMNLCEKLSYYKHNKRFKSPIITNSKNVLLDGYITYLISKMLDIKELEVWVMDYDTSDQIKEQECSILEIVGQLKELAKVNG